MIHLILSLALFPMGFAAKNPNVVLIVSDDLRAQLNTNGFMSDNGLPSSPNLGTLSKTGFTFNHAYANQALCGPSRNSFLSGRRPQTTGAYNFVDSFRDVGANWTTLPGLFKNNGYTTVGTGKVFHPGLPPNNDMPFSWDDRMNNGTWDPWMYPTEDACPEGTAWCGTQNETDLEDYKVTHTAKKLLNNITKVEKPFFLAVGYRKPHLQWRVPQRVLDRVKLSAVSSPANPYLPRSTPDLAYHMPVDDFLLEFTDVEKCGSGNLTDPSAWFSEDCAKLWRRGYYAAVSYMDEQVGVILDELKQRNLEKSTIVVFFGDHGWHLGEWGMWEKFSNFELALRTPMFIRAPNMGSGLISSPVELIDVYKTLVDLSGLALPDGEIIEGDSLVPLMKGEGRSDLVAYSQFPRCLNGKNYALNFPLSRDDREIWDTYNDGIKPTRRNREPTEFPEWKLTNCNEVS